MSETMHKSAIELISENIVNTKFENLSEWNIKNAKDRIIDIVGCIIGGSKASGNDGLIKIVKNWGGKEEAPVFIHGGRVPVGDAAMINCISCRSNDFEAMFVNIEGQRVASHNSGTTIPLTLTMSDVYGLNGKEFLTSMIIGDDVTARILVAGGWDFALGWDGTMTLPIFGSVAIAGRIMGLSVEQIKNAFGISVNMVAGAVQSLWDAATTFKLGQGTSARNGIFAAELAQQGWVGLDDALLGGKAYYFLYGKGKPDQPEVLTQYLGKKYYVEESFKRYPCGIPNTPFIDAGIKIHNQYGLNPTDIKEIELGLSPSSSRVYYAQQYKLSAFPQASAIFSYQYTACCALLRGRCKIQDFTTEAICDPEVQDLISKSFFTDRSDLPGRMVGIRITTNDGKVYEHLENVGQAMHSYPSKEILEAKYWDQVEAFNGISKAKAQKILDLIYKIEDIGNMRELTELLMP